MRLLGIFLGVLCPIAVLAQNKPSNGDQIRPQAIIQVSRTNVGTDLVSITVSDPNYPPKLLQSQAQTVGLLTSGESKGLQVYREPIKEGAGPSGLWKAIFAVTGLVNSKLGFLRMEPLARALAGAPEPYTLHAFYIDFDGSRIGPTTLSDFTSASVLVRGREEGPSVEYAVTLLSQDPNTIRIPASRELESPAPVPAQPERAGTDWIVVSAFAIGAVAAGASVYSLLLIWLRSGRRNGSHR